MRGSIVWLAFAAVAALLAFAAVNGLRKPAPQRPQPAAATAALPGGSGGAGKATGTGAAAALPAPGFDVVTVDPHGQAVIAGHAAAGDRVRVLADGKPIGEATADANGQWVLLPKALAPGDRELTLEATGKDGGAVRRSQDKVALSVPQQAGPAASGATAPPVAVAAAAGERLPAAPANDAASTWLVQHGNNLWEIARHLYGEGERYTAIYDANRAQIRNPDLIYPGQQFALPKH